MRTRITQEEAYAYLKTLPEEISLHTFQEFHKKSLVLRLTTNGLQFTFTEEDLPNTYNIKNFRLTYFYKGQETKKRVPLGVGSMALWTTIFQYMANVEEESKNTYQTVPFNVKGLRYIGTEDESEGVSSISSNVELPYRLTHTFLTEEDEPVLFTEDYYNRERKTGCIYNHGTVKLNYLEEDVLTKKASWGQVIDSELSKKLKEEQELYQEYLDSSELDEEDSLT